MKTSIKLKWDSLDPIQYDVQGVSFIKLVNYLKSPDQKFQLEKPS